MKRGARLAVVIVLGLALWPEFTRYVAEWRLTEANMRLQRALQESRISTVTGAPVDAIGARNQAGLALHLAEQASAALPGDPRAVLANAIALIMNGRGADAVSLLDAAIAVGERPEFTLNLGRARTTLGDAAGANAAYLRTAWASPHALATLPKAMREDFQRQADALDSELRAGRLTAPPPLRAPDATK